MDTSTRVYLHDIAVAVPERSYSQDYALSLMQRLHLQDRRSQRLLSRIYSNSGISKRHSVVEDFANDPAEYALFPKNESMRPEPSTRMRNDLYVLHARSLSREAAAGLLGDREFLRKKVTHLITVSCTGFSAPGFDFYLVKDLPLGPNVHRYHLGFMGCYAAFPALKLAQSICRAEPEARVLVVNVEICSLHLQFKDEADIMVANAIFADGASAALVSAVRDDSEGPALHLQHFQTHTVPESESDMAWTIGDTGFDMRLSAYVPRLIEQNISPILESALMDAGLRTEDIDTWAIHPGGRAILDRVASALQIQRSELKVSYDVLNEYGNMSSVTIMFVLKRILESASGGNIFAAAFGPGLTIESASLQLT